MHLTQRRRSHIVDVAFGLVTIERIGEIVRVRNKAPSHGLWIWIDLRSQRNNIHVTLSVAFVPAMDSHRLGPTNSSGAARRGATAELPSVRSRCSAVSMTATAIAIAIGLRVSLVCSRYAAAAGSSPILTESATSLRLIVQTLGP